MAVVGSIACTSVAPKEATLPVPDASGRAYFTGDPDSSVMAAFITRTLRASREPSLRATSASEAYRVISSRSLVAHELIVRIERNGSTVQVVAKVYEAGRPSYFWGSVTLAEHLEAHASGEVVSETRRRASEAQWTELQRRLTRAGFWDDSIEDPNRIGVDGDNCIIEGARDGRHRWLRRWEPEGPFKELCDYMLRLPDVQGLGAAHSMDAAARGSRRSGQSI